MSSIRKYLIAMVAVTLLVTGCSYETVETRAKNTVVKIERLKEVNGEMKPVAMGAGVIVSSDGHILTNRHVVGDSEKVRVSFIDGPSGKAGLIGEVLWVSEKGRDLALVEVHREFDNYASIREYPVTAGDKVFAVGHPYGLEWSVTFGRVSAIRNAERGRRVQTDVVLGPGNSGGPMFDEWGRVIGLSVEMQSAGYAAYGLVPSGITFAIPARTICNLIFCKGQ